MIRGDLESAHASILDLGAESGFFCHRFEEQGMSCRAVEENPEKLGILRALCRASNRKFEIFDTVPALLAQPSTPEFDAVLALNLFSAVESQPGRRAVLQNYLRQLSYRRLYLLSSVAGDEEPRPRLHGSEGCSALADFARQLNMDRLEPCIRLDNGKTLFRLMLLE